MNTPKTIFFKTLIPKDLSLSELGLWLLIPLASFTSHTWLPIPPTMVLFLGAIVCWLFLQFDEPSKIESVRVENSRSLRGVISVFFVFITYIFMSQYFIGATFRHYMGAIFAPLYLILILIFSKDTSMDYLKNSGQKFIRYSIVILCVEAVLRYGNNLYYIILDSNAYYGFYTFKFNGPMYLTSNAVACHLVTLLFFILWWGRTYKQSMKKEFFIVFGLIILTFSRASIPAVILGLFYYYFFKDLNWKKSLLTLFSIGIVGVFVLLVLRYFITDYSFQSKFLIFEEATLYYKTADIKSILFGIGFYETKNIMTHYAHNYFLLFLMETGVTGIILLCVTLLIFVKTTNGTAMVVLVPFIIQTAAESITFMPYFYVIMALMIVLGKTSNLKSILE
jgi:hypothetical protein